MASLNPVGTPWVLCPISSVYQGLGLFRCCSLLSRRRSITATVGTSFVKYGECGFWTRDTYLSSWLTALFAELRKTTKPEPWHKPLMEYWSVQIEIDGGFISAALDQFLTDSERRDSLISTSELALRNCDPSANRTGELFVALLRGALKTTESSPIDYLDDPS
jgi:hypothetical protein